MKKQFIFIFISVLGYTQKLQLLNYEKDTVSYRGLSVVSEQVFWVSGSNGTVGKTIDSGKNFTWYNPQGYEKTDFRDIHALNTNEAYILGITKPAVILHTKDGGTTWQNIYLDTDEKAFLDALDCIKNNCIAIGDAVKPNEFYFIANNNSSFEKKYSDLFTTETGEAYFAASGSNLKTFSNKDFIVVSGGLISRILYQYNGVTHSQKIPIVQGKETTGANSFDFLNSEKKGIIVGGDFLIPNDSTQNLVLFQWNKKNKSFDFTNPQKTAEGYKSSVAYLTSKKVICCGISGVDISNDGGLNWKNISKESYNTVQKLSSKQCILVGSKGKITELYF